MSLQKILLKIIVLGDVGVGKTSLIDRYAHRKFNQQYRTTIGADFVTKELQVDDKVVNLQIWDTAGQERFRSLGSAFYRGADCCVLVYDANVLKSFESLQHWHQDFIKQVDIPDATMFPFVLIGNKTDGDGGVNRAVTERVAKEWCESVGGNIPYFETSAKENVNVDAAFQCAAAAALYHEPYSTTDICFERMASSISDFEQRGSCAC